ncbi:HAMP domain-containing histidine kinase [bacterium]|nr:HAMP domain-containing histidine kinase [bacterium]
MTTDIKQDELQKQIRCVSHEIRNHLSICDMYSQILRKNLEKNGIKNSSIDNAIDCIQKSIQIIGSNLLDLKSLNNSKPKIIDFKTIIEKSSELSKAYICEKDIEINTFVKNTALISADENRLLASIVNIIKNGIESIEIKGKIEILAEIKDQTGVIKICNNGKPISKEKQKDIFNEGYSTKKTGCGLGLYICKNYLKDQNATLELTKSGKDQTQFEIRIPTLEQ